MGWMSLGSISAFLGFTTLTKRNKREKNKVNIKDGLFGVCLFLVNDLEGLEYTKPEGV